MRNFYTVLEGYSHFFEAAFHSLSPLHHAFGILESNCELGIQGQLRIQIRMRPGFEFSRDFFIILQGLVEGLPRIWGMSPCESVCIWDGHGVELQLTAPVSLSILAQLRQKITSVLSPSFLTRELQYTNLALQQKTAALEAKVRELNEARHVQEAVLLRSEMSQLAKSDFLSAMSHELRTPLNGIVGLAELLIEQAESDPIKDDLKTILDSSQELKMLVDRILDYAQLAHENSSPEWSDVNISQILQELAERSAPLCYRKGLNFSNLVPGSLPKIRSDARRIDGVLNIFMANAIKHSSQGQISVRAAVTPTNITIEIVDQGPGIRSDRISEVFSGFKNMGTIQSETLLQSGKLALALAAKMAETLHGVVSASSQPEKGSSFTLQLPLQLPKEETSQTKWKPEDWRPAPRRDEVSASESSSSKSLAPSLPGLKILIVEDNPLNRAVTERILIKDGHRVTTANYGIEAIRLCRKEPFDIVLLDICLPGMDGISAGKAILDSVEPKPRVLAYTASVSDGDKKACMAAGFHGFIAKPIAPKELLLALRESKNAFGLTLGFLSGSAKLNQFG
jgi:signal transduction histidine kinase/CheY-like chemotaxis protein